jgi:hypothetical protein
MFCEFWSELLVNVVYCNVECQLVVCVGFRMYIPYRETRLNPSSEIVVF